MKDDNIYCNQQIANKTGNLFESVLILSQRMRELRAGHKSLVAGNTFLISAYVEIEQGKIGKSYLYKDPPRLLKRDRRK